MLYQPLFCRLFDIPGQQNCLPVHGNLEYAGSVVAFFKPICRRIKKLEPHAIPPPDLILTAAAESCDTTQSRWLPGENIHNPNTAQQILRPSHVIDITVAEHESVYLTDTLTLQIGKQHR